MYQVSVQYGIVIIAMSIIFLMWEGIDLIWTSIPFGKSKKAKFKMY